MEDLRYLREGHRRDLSDLPANRELVRHGENGWIVGEVGALSQALDRLAPKAASIAQANHEWVRQHALFEPCVQRFVERLRELEASCA